METIHKDVFVFLQEHQDKAKSITDRFMEDAVDRNYNGIICISGVSGCGKSEIAHFVEQELYDRGVCSHIVNLDRYYKVHHSIREEWRKKTGTIGSDEIDWERVRDEIRKYENNTVRVLIVEGLYAARVSGLRFHIDCGIEEAEDFRKFRNKEPEGTKWRDYVVGEEYSDILSQVQKCDYVI